MPSHPTQLKFDTDFEPKTGQLVTIAPGLARITAPNSGPFTFTGTNTFIVGDENIGIIDPGPDDDDHLKAIIGAVAGRTVTAILLTHTHKDHSNLVRRLTTEINAPIWFEGAHHLSRPRRTFEFNPLSGACDWRLTPDRKLIDGEIIQFGKTALKVIATPGHCANHLAFGVVDTDFMLTGDHVMGWSSTLVATPDGSMADYLSSLDRLLELEWNHYLPAHGGAIKKGRDFAKALKAHRIMRNTQILDALAAKGLTATDLLNQIYPKTQGRLRFAARLTLSAHLEFLVQTGKVSSKFSFTGRQYFPT